jgi:hypothetical protein
MHVREPGEGGGGGYAETQSMLGLDIIVEVQISTILLL